MTVLEVLREANLMSPRLGEWSTLPEVNSAQTFDSTSPITHSQLSKLVKSGVAESAFIEGQTMYRAAGQAAKPGGEGLKDRSYQPPEGRDGYPKGDYDETPRGAPVAVPLPVGGIVSGAESLRRGTNPDDALRRMYSKRKE